MTRTDFTMNKTKRRLPHNSNRLRLATVIWAALAFLLLLKRRCEKCREGMEKIDIRMRHLKLGRFSSE